MSKTGTGYDYFVDRTDARTERNKKKWIRAKEAVARYGVSRPTIMHWAEESGALLKINKTVLIDSESIELYLEGYRVPGGVY